jgi:hypothetical protein
MKLLVRLSFFVFVFILLNNQALGQEIPDSDVPASVISAFNTLFTKSKNVHWTKENFGHYEAHFKSKGKGMRAVFDANGLLQRTFEPVRLGDVPVKIREEANKLMGDYRLDKSWLVTTPDKKKMFFLLMKKGKETRNLTYESNFEYLGENYFDDQRTSKP